MADNFETIKCPACQKEMHKVFVPSQGINLDVCLDGCGGIYFDNREFTAFDEKHEPMEEIVDVLGKKEFTKVDGSLPRSCPVCGAKMVKNYASVKKEVQIDECYACGGKFLDYGELGKIRVQYENELERSADTLRVLYDTVGMELKALDEENARLERERSWLKRFFDKLVGMNSRI